MEIKKINLSDYQTNYFVGYYKGAKLRKLLDLDSLPKGSKVIVDIPIHTCDITTSFFLGLFSKSIKDAGSKKNFLNSFSFETHGKRYPVINRSISRSLSCLKVSL